MKNPSWRKRKRTTTTCEHHLQEKNRPTLTKRKTKKTEKEIKNELASVVDERKECRHTHTHTCDDECSHCNLICVCKLITHMHSDSPEQEKKHEKKETKKGNGVRE